MLRARDSLSHFHVEQKWELAGSVHETLLYFQGKFCVCSRAGRKYAYNCIHAVGVVSFDGVLYCRCGVQKCMQITALGVFCFYGLRSRSFFEIFQEVKEGMN